MSVARIVDICGRDPGVPAFEAESVELSGRGMQVRATYLPPIGAPLVCRLDHDGREIVVEGLVAWQKDAEGGGELGIQFTALDSGSVEALKSLCGLDGEPKAPAAPAATAKAKEPALEPEVHAAPGAPVKLHIEGLGAPMKARVKDGGTRRLQVGSNLEFLKVGRGLQVEDVEQGDRRGARIDAVSIAIDPETQVPQLVVVLRYEGADTTPEPSVVDDEVAAATVSSAGAEAAVRESAPRSTDEVDESADASEAESEDDDANAFRGKVDVLAVKVGRVMQDTSVRLREKGGTAASRFVAWAKQASADLGERAARRGEKAQKRTTAKAPVSAAPATRRLRPQNGETEPQGAAPGARKKLIVGATAGGALLLAGLVFGLSGGSKEEEAVAAAPPTPSAEATATLYAPPATGAVTPAPAGNAGVVANVPLFGPTPMATLEPAPLGPTPEELASAGVPLNSGQATSGVEERMDDPGADDESFDDGKGETASASRTSEEPEPKKSTEVAPEDVKPWVSGKLYLPIIHRIKLDKPGTAIKGSAEAKGFSVVIPGRKPLDSGAGISKRDDRISSVKATTAGGGAKVTFSFRGKVPSYKVRLKKDYVEFFISSPERSR